MSDPPPSAPPAPPAPAGELLVGAHVRKQFQEGWFGGVVTSFRAGAVALYRVRYDDGDEEDLALPELSAILAAPLAGGAGDRGSGEPATGDAARASDGGANAGSASESAIARAPSSHTAGKRGAGGGQEVLVEAGVLVPQPVPLTVSHGERCGF